MSRVIVTGKYDWHASGIILTGLYIDRLVLCVSMVDDARRGAFLDIAGMFSERIEDLELRKKLVNEIVAAMDDRDAAISVLDKIMEKGMATVSEAKAARNTVENVIWPTRRGREVEWAIMDGLRQPEKEAVANPGKGVNELLHERADIFNCIGQQNLRLEQRGDEDKVERQHLRSIVDVMFMIDDMLHGK